MQCRKPPSSHTEMKSQPPFNPLYICFWPAWQVISILKGNPFLCSKVAVMMRCRFLGSCLSCTVDDSLDQSDTSKSTLQRKPKLQDFFDHCCQICHNSFCIKKCGSSECMIWKHVQTDGEHFKGIHFLPDPLIDSDDHWVPFTDVYSTDTSENERLSLIQRRKMKDTGLFPKWPACL